jgi:hypothetical protein
MRAVRICIFVAHTLPFFSFDPLFLCSGTLVDSTAQNVANSPFAQVLSSILSQDCSAVSVRLPPSDQCNACAVKLLRLLCLCKRDGFGDKTLFLILVAEVVC